MKLIHGDCLDVMPALPESSVDTVISDPPYGLSFMGKAWDHGVPGAPFWEAALRVAKPGAMLLAFGGTRTYHRLTCAIEDAGWEIRDCLMWLYGTGFPKSLDISKAIDKAAGPSDTAKLWHGWGTALKPAWEPIIVAMKPLDGTFADNAIEHSVAGLNIDGCRIGTEQIKTDGRKCGGEQVYNGRQTEGYRGGSHVGRWPANLLLDREAASQLDEHTGELKPGVTGRRSSGVGIFDPGAHGFWGGYGDTGGASRFFYVAKASKRERGEGNNHPTVKPLALLEYLCRLTATPRGGVVLDPFMGSGTTGVACANRPRLHRY